MKVRDIYKFFNELVQQRPDLLDAEAIIHHPWSSAIGEITRLSVAPMENYDVESLGWGDTPAETEATDIVVVHIAD